MTENEIETKDETDATNGKKKREKAVLPPFNKELTIQYFKKYQEKKKEADALEATLLVVKSEAAALAAKMALEAGAKAFSYQGGDYLVAAVGKTATYTVRKRGSIVSLDE